MMRYRRRPAEPEHAWKAGGLAAAAGLGLAAVVFYVAWTWLRREPVTAGEGAPAPEERPDGS